jgi:hypothetical protein
LPGKNALAYFSQPSAKKKNRFFHLAVVVVVEVEVKETAFPAVASRRVIDERKFLKKEVGNCKLRA